MEGYKLKTNLAASNALSNVVWNFLLDWWEEKGYFVNENKVYGKLGDEIDFLSPGSKPELILATNGYYYWPYNFRKRMNRLEHAQKVIGDEANPQVIYSGGHDPVNNKYEWEVLEDRINSTQAILGAYETFTPVE